MKKIPWKNPLEKLGKKSLEKTLKNHMKNSIKNPLIFFFVFQLQRIGFTYVGCHHGYANILRLSLCLRTQWKRNQVHFNASSKFCEICSSLFCLAWLSPKWLKMHFVSSELLHLFDAAAAAAVQHFPRAAKPWQKQDWKEFQSISASGLLRLWTNKIK